MAESLTVDIIPARPGLDPVTVYWHDLGPGEGRVTLLCFDSSWTAYWRAMGESTIRQFFASCDSSYLADKLGYGSVLKKDKRSQGYLARIITAVRDHLKATTATPAPIPTPPIQPPPPTEVFSSEHAVDASSNPKITDFFKF